MGGGSILYLAWESELSHVSQRAPSNSDGRLSQSSSRPSSGERTEGQGEALSGCLHWNVPIFLEEKSVRFRQSAELFSDSLNYTGKKASSSLHPLQPNSDCSSLKSPFDMRI